MPSTLVSGNSLSIACEAHVQFTSIASGLRSVLELLSATFFEDIFNQVG